MWAFKLPSDIWLCSVAVITPDSDNRTFRQPRFESGHDLADSFLLLCTLSSRSGYAICPSEGSEGTVNFFGVFPLTR